MLLKGKVALVTGASRGIGRACALKLAEEGAVVGINYVGKENEEDAKEIEKEINYDKGKAVCFDADVSSFSSVNAMFEEVEEKLGAVNILVNNAGITSDSLLMRMKEEQWDKVIAVNLKGVFNCSKVCIKGMIKNKGGKIINIASVVGITGNAGQANYAASKAGIIGFSKSLAKEVANRNIQINCVAPGYIQTGMTDELDNKVKDKVLEAIPLGRLGLPEDVANAVVFLASSNSDYITGHVVSVDGGMVI